MQASYTEKPVKFPDGTTTLSGVLCLPVAGAQDFVQGSAPGSTNVAAPAERHPAIVYVAGSGPAGRDGYGVLPPLWQAFAAAGYAGLAWDKPGVGASTGDWRLQSTRDRAREVVAAIDFLKARPEIDPKRIGVWGISQAGWILPVVSALAQGDLASMILVSPPVNSAQSQELFRVAHQLPADGFEEEAVEQALMFSTLRFELMSRDFPYDTYAYLERLVDSATWLPEVGRFGREEYEFIQERVRADASELPVSDYITRITCPVLAIFGGLDTIVDVEESARFYREALPRAGNRNVTVKVFPSADHVIFPSQTGGGRELDRSFQREEKIFAPGYIESMVTWLRELT